MRSPLCLISDFFYNAMIRARHFREIIIVSVFFYEIFSHRSYINNIMIFFSLLSGSASKPDLAVGQCRSVTSRHHNRTSLATRYFVIYIIHFCFGHARKPAAIARINLSVTLVFYFIFFYYFCLIYYDYYYSSYNTQQSIVFGRRPRVLKHVRREMCSVRTTPRHI